MVGKLLLLSVPAIVVTLLFLELVVFRFWIAVGDIPIEAFDAPTSVLHYRPEQHGKTYPDGNIHHPVPFVVNGDGWSSIHASYEKARNDKARVAVIGDSYVAAFEVEPKEALAAALEAALGEQRAEVFPFGERGAPLSQYLHLARYVARTYDPDVIVIVIVHNDFDESYRPPVGRYTSAFLHLRLGTDGEVEGEIPPQPYRESALSRLARSNSALLRFLLYRSQAARELLHRAYSMFAGRPVRYEANVDLSRVAGEDEEMRAVARYVFAKLVELQRASGIRIFLVMDAPREPIYEGRDPRQAAAYRMNRIAAAAAAQSGLNFADLTAAFERDFREHRERFEFATDGHWNVRGHRVAADAVCEMLRSADLRGRSGRPLKCAE